jgi:hypothetical protein
MSHEGGLHLVKKLGGHVDKQRWMFALGVPILIKAPIQGAP